MDKKRPATNPPIINLTSDSDDENNNNNNSNSRKRYRRFSSNTLTSSNTHELDLVFGKYEHNPFYEVLKTLLPLNQSEREKVIQDNVEKLKSEIEYSFKTRLYELQTKTAKLLDKLVKRKEKQKPVVNVTKEIKKNKIYMHIYSFIINNVKYAKVVTDNFLVRFQFGDVPNTSSCVTEIGIKTLFGYDPKWKRTSNIPFYYTISHEEVEYEQFIEDDDSSSEEEDDEFEFNPYNEKEQEALKVLGLDSKVTKRYNSNRLRKAYLKRTLQTHPDKRRENKEAATKEFKELGQAKEVLGIKLMQPPLKF